MDAGTLHNAIAEFSPVESVLVVKHDDRSVKTLKSDLVTDGILTQARADEIFL